MNNFFPFSFMSRLSILLLLAIFQPVNLYALETQAEAYYFLTNNRGKICCKIESKENHTVRINKFIHVTRGSGFLSFSRDVEAEQEAKGNVIIPEAVDLVHVAVDGKTTPMGKYKVIAIDNDGLKGCKELTSITLPESVEKIGSNAFGGCSDLKTINLQGTIKYIDLNLANGCTSLQAINVNSKGNTTYSSFDGILCCNGEVVFCPPVCNANVVIPSTVKSIGVGAFENNIYLLSVTSNSEESIKKGAFKNCSNLKEIKLGKGCKSIGDEAFLNCYSLQQISIPSSVTEIGSSAFQGCMALTSVVFNDIIKTIGSDAFKDCIELKEISLPKSLQVIRSGTFANCSNLGRIIFPEGLRWIYSEAFVFCISLRDVAFPSSLESIGEKAFMGCTALEKVVFNPQIKEISRYAFFGCSSLSSANVPKQATTYNETFMDCINLPNP